MQENIDLDSLYSKKRRQLIEKLEEEYVSDKNKLKLKHAEEKLKLRSEYNKGKKQVADDFKKQMKNIEKNLGNNVIDTMKQKDKDIKLLVYSINLKKINEITNIRIKKVKESKLVSCDAIKLEYLPSKMGNLGSEEKINNEEIKIRNENNVE